MSPLNSRSQLGFPELGLVPIEQQHLPVSIDERQCASQRLVANRSLTDDLGSICVAGWDRDDRLVTRVLSARIRLDSWSVSRTTVNILECVQNYRQTSMLRSQIRYPQHQPFSTTSASARLRGSV
jgi:hypothetical protein